MSWCIENLKDCQAWRDEGLSLSTTSNEASRLFDAGVRQYVSWIEPDQLGGLDLTCEKMIAADPYFVMGKVLTMGLDLLGTGKTTRLDKEFEASLQNLLSQSSKQSTSLTPREKLHVNAIQQFADGYLKEATYTWENILKENPRDVLALKFAHDSYFYLGNQTEMRDSIQRVLPHWNEHTVLYSHLKGMLSFGLEENNQFSEAEKVGLEALNLNPQDGWATHAMAHVYEMENRYSEGIRFMTGTLKDWTSCGLLACHNYWHWALYHLERGEQEVALGIFEREIGKRSQSGAMLDLVDAASLLYRFQLEGMNVDKLWGPVEELCRPHIDDHILTFNDAHLLMSFLGNGDGETVKQYRESLSDFVRNASGTNQEISKRIALPLTEAMVLFDEQDYAGAADLLLPIEDQIVDIGGSNAQGTEISDGKEVEIRAKRITIARLAKKYKLSSEELGFLRYCAKHAVGKRNPNCILTCDVIPKISVCFDAKGSVRNVTEIEDQKRK